MEVPLEVALSTEVGASNVLLMRGGVSSTLDLVTKKVVLKVGEVPTVVPKVEVVVVVVEVREVSTILPNTRVVVVVVEIEAVVRVSGTGDVEQLAGKDLKHVSK